MTRRSVPLVIACALSVLPLSASAQTAPDASPSLPETVDELPDQPAAAVRIEGNRRVDADVVLRQLKSRPGEPIDGATLREDLRTLYGLGFFQDAQVRLRESPEGPVVVFVVAEKPAVREVRYEGFDVLKEADLEELVQIRPFSILDTTKVEASARAMEAKYREKGRFLAEVGWRLVPVPAENAVDVVFVADERSKVVVKELRFSGNENVSDEELEAMLETREGGYFSFLTGSGTYQEEAFERDLMRISGAYYDRGFINAKVGKPIVSLSPDRQYVYITVPVEEGEAYDVGSLQVSGDVLGNAERLRAMLRLTEGELFVRSKLVESVFALQDYYRDRGYAYVNVTPDFAVDTEEKTIDLDLRIERGEQVHVSRIEIRGNTRTRDKVIRREMRIAEGELYSGTAIKASRQRISALGFFENVDVATKPGKEPDEIELEITVKERPTGTFQVGAGLSSGEGIIANAQISHENLFGRGQSLSLMLQHSRLRTIFQVQFMEPYFMDTDWTLAFSAFNTRADYFTFISSRTGGSLTAGYPLRRISEDLRLFLTYTLEDVSEEFERPIPSKYGDAGLTSGLKLTVSYDSRNDRMFPSRGQYHTASIEHAPTWLGSENSFSRYSFVGRLYFPLPWGIVGRIKGEVGQIEGELDRIPLSERFFLGGVYNLRGYYLRTIGPTEEFPTDDRPDAPTSPFRVGGNKQVLVNTELEFPLLPPMGLRGVVFYDMGNAYANNEGWFEDLEDDLPLGMFHSAGLGVRWFSPIGPLRFEWGVPLTRRPTDDRIRFEFTVGNFF